MADTKRENQPQRESQPTQPGRTGSPESPEKEGQKAGENPRRSGKDMNRDVEKETDQPNENIETGRTGSSNTEQGI